MPRRTKIVATLGPATDAKHVLDEMIQAGMDVVRVNFSYGTHEDHIKRAERVRNRARSHGHQVGVLADLQGPKIRIERFKEGMIQLEENDNFIFDTALSADAGNRERVGVTYKSLQDDVSRGDTLLLDDGLLVLWVEEVQGTEVRCRVVVGGRLTNSKGINRLGGGLSAASITEKDREDIKVAAAMEADYIFLVALMIFTRRVNCCVQQVGMVALLPRLNVQRRLMRSRK
jgi:pyruvate kinase